MLANWFGRTQKLGPDTLEGRDLLNTDTRLGYHFEVPLTDLISFLIDEKRKKTCTLIDIGHMIGGKVDKWNFKAVPKPSKCFYELSTLQ
jgi:hypothetical protein